MKLHLNIINIDNKDMSSNKELKKVVNIFRDTAKFRFVESIQFGTVAATNNVVILNVEMIGDDNTTDSVIYTEVNDDYIGKKRVKDMRRILRIQTK